VLLTRPLALRAALAAVVLAALVLAATSHLHLSDVRVYRAGGRAVLGGGLYDLRVGTFGFTYPPFAAAVFAVIAWLPLPVMFIALTVASVVALLVVLRGSVPGIDHRWPGLACAVPLVLSRPVIATFAWGQVDLVLAGLVLHDLLVRRRGDLVGVAAAIKLTPAVFVLYLLLSGRRREARTAMVTVLGAAGIGAVLAPSASWRYWTHEAFAGGGVGGFDHTDNQSIRGLAERIAGAGGGTAVWLLLAVPVLVVGLVQARRASAAGAEVLAVGVVGITACLVSPVSWTHHWVWCIPCLAGLRVLALLVAGALAVNPFQFGPVIGHGYPIIALLAFAVGWQSHVTRAAEKLPTCPPAPTVTNRPGAPMEGA
jgi:alpha-1,2-mannosyltransferase